MNRPKRAAILFVHGILGTPRHFAPFLPYVPASWSVCNLLLEGHGGSVRDFSHAAMAQWKQQVHAALDALLAEHDRVLITAHSMGTLFAIQEALQRPVTELFLLNPPLNVRVTARLFKTVWTVFRGKAAPQDAWMLAAQNAYSIEKTAMFCDTSAGSRGIWSCLPRSENEKGRAESDGSVAYISLPAR